MNLQQFCFDQSQLIVKKRALIVFLMPVGREMEGEFLAFRCVIAGRHENLKLMSEVLS